MQKWTGSEKIWGTLRLSGATLCRRFSLCPFTPASTAHDALSLASRSAMMPLYPCKQVHRLGRQTLAMISIRLIEVISKDCLDAHSTCTTRNPRHVGGISCRTRGSLPHIHVEMAASIVMGLYKHGATFCPFFASNTRFHIIGRPFAFFFAIIVNLSLIMAIYGTFEIVRDSKVVINKRDF